jgi:hypothetical protein
MTRYAPILANNWTPSLWPRTYGPVVRNLADFEKRTAHSTNTKPDAANRQLSLTSPPARLVSIPDFLGREP